MREGPEAVGKAGHRNVSPVMGRPGKAWKGREGQARKGAGKSRQGMGLQVKRWVGRARQNHGRFGKVM